jgi:hypothetical protein
VMVTFAGVSVFGFIPLSASVKFTMTDEAIPIPVAFAGGETDAITGDVRSVLNCKVLYAAIALPARS